MFIAIDARADVQGSKKGKLTPAQHAQLNAWCLRKKTGIFNILGKCEYDTSKTSLTPLNNIVKVVFKKGYIAICGRIIECEEGTEVNITIPVNSSGTGRIVLRYNLANTGDGEFEVTTTSQNLIQEDLNENPLTGVYELELYNYTYGGASITLTRNNTPIIESVDNSINSILTSISSLNTQITTVNLDLSSYKTTTNNRLKNLENNAPVTEGSIEAVNDRIDDIIDGTTPVVANGVKGYSKANNQLTGFPKNSIVSFNINNLTVRNTAGESFSLQNVQCMCFVGDLTTGGVRRYPIQEVHFLDASNAIKAHATLCAKITNKGSGNHDIELEICNYSGGVTSITMQSKYIADIRYFEII